MADISGVKDGDLKEISDGLEGLSCECRPGGRRTTDLTPNSTHLDENPVLGRSIREGRVVDLHMQTRRFNTGLGHVIDQKPPDGLKRPGRLEWIDIDGIDGRVRAYAAFQPGSGQASEMGCLCMEGRELREELLLEPAESWRGINITEVCVCRGTPHGCRFARTSTFASWSRMHTESSVLRKKDLMMIREGVPTGDPSASGMARRFTFRNPNPAAIPAFPPRPTPSLQAPRLR